MTEGCRNLCTPLSSNFERARRFQPDKNTDTFQPSAATVVGPKKMTFRSTDSQRSRSRSGGGVLGCR